MVDFLENYSYSALLMIFTYIIAMAVICMAYGGGKSHRRSREDASADLFFIEYMISIVLVPVACILLTLSLKGKLT